MARDLLRDGEGRFFRGNIHCHSDLSDGQTSPEHVIGAYRDAGYDFLCLSDHFEAASQPPTRVRPYPVPGLLLPRHGSRRRRQTRLE